MAVQACTHALVLQATMIPTLLLLLWLPRWVRLAISWRATGIHGGALLVGRLLLRLPILGPGLLYSLRIAWPILLRCCLLWVVLRSLHVHKPLSFSWSVFCFVKDERARKKFVIKAYSMTAFCTA